MNKNKPLTNSEILYVVYELIVITFIAMFLAIVLSDFL